MVPSQLTCPLCRSTEFQREEQRTEGRWRVTKHVITLMICTQCRYVMTFYDKRGANLIGG